MSRFIKWRPRILSHDAHICHVCKKDSKRTIELEGRLTFGIICKDCLILMLEALEEKVKP